LAGDLNVKHPSWNITVSNPSGQKLLQLFDTNDLTSALQGPTHYPLVENGDVLDIVVHKNIRLSNDKVNDILDSDHQYSTSWNMLERNKSRYHLKIFIDWERHGDYTETIEAKAFRTFPIQK
jgi:hypothetical protein